MVKVITNNGNVITPFEGNSEKGFVVVQSNTQEFKGGWINNRKRTATIKGDIEALQEMGFVEGQELPGKIQILESTTQSFDGQEPKINPQHATVERDDNGKLITYGEDAVLRVDDQPIYRNSVYTVDENAQDEFVQHTNVQVNAEAQTI